MEDYGRHLFPYLNPERLTTWSCGHIIPKQNLIVCPVSQGAKGPELDFTYEKRNSKATIGALSGCLIDLCAAIPNGLVVFFPSYRYLDNVLNVWKTQEAREGESVWLRLSKQKSIFMESKEVSSVDDILYQYTESIKGGKGGLLLSVIGGKMSEGINFSDKLGRGVVVVGLPFPNAQTAQWKAKLEYIERRTIKQGGSFSDGKQTARDFYENTCMRAVNQSIGRAIRHQNDYASIVLLDVRYQTSRIQNKLPGWIKQGLLSQKDAGSWNSVCGSLHQFFKSKDSS